MDKYIEIERSIIKKYRKTLWSKFTKAITDYELLSEGDNIMVCISGGKDSFLMAKCFQEIACHGKIKFNAHYVVMNPGYSKDNLDKIKDNAKILNIPIEIFDTDIFITLSKMGTKSPCYMCARMRRGALYSKAKELGCNKIALGHHFDDVIETNLLNILYSGEIKTMMPKLKSKNFPGIELIRPMYYIRESDIIAWTKYNNLEFLNCACLVARKEIESKRLEIKNLIKSLKKVSPYIEMNIFRSMENIHLKQVLGYLDSDDNKHNFLEKY